VDVWKVGGILCAAGGAVFMVTFGKLDATAYGTVLGGSACFFINCVTFTLFLIFCKATLLKYPPITTMSYTYSLSFFGMLIAQLVVASSKDILHFLCEECDDAWNVPVATYGALAYWIIMVSGVGYIALTWANQHVDPSINLAYSVMQPVTAAALSALLLALGVVNRCRDGVSEDKTCLYGLSWGDLGAIGIAVGLALVIYSDRKQRLAQPPAIIQTKTEEVEISEQP
jgi:drug/metabolite transporter (DMT)-like permease